LVALLPVLFLPGAKGAAAERCEWDILLIVRQASVRIERSVAGFMLRGLLRGGMNCALGIVGGVGKKAILRIKTSGSFGRCRVLEIQGVPGVADLMDCCR
jgi:hypothetical protein